MKRFFAALIAVLLLLAIPTVANAAAEEGEMLISSDKVTGEVDSVVKVDFYLYANLPDGRLLDSLSGTMKFDPEFLTLGAINQEDPDQNLVSLMKGKASNFQYNISENGTMNFAFIDAFGVEGSGFWFQAEFRIEKEGATDFVFNGISYTGIDDAYSTVSYYIEPRSVGGVYTEGESVPTDNAVEETFAPLTPAVATPVVTTPTPKPSNSGQQVPVTSTLPTFSANPSAPSGLVTPQPAVTSMPMTTHEAGASAPTGTETEAPAAETAPAEVVEPTEEVPAEETPAAPVAEAPGDTAVPAEITPNDTTKTEPAAVEETGNSNTILIIGVIIGIVAVIGLGALAIVLVLKRRKMNEEDE